MLFVQAMHRTRCAPADAMLPPAAAVHPESPLLVYTHPDRIACEMAQISEHGLTASDTQEHAGQALPSHSAMALEPHPCRKDTQQQLATVPPQCQ